MKDELVLADSAGHTMIDIDAPRAADRGRGEKAELFSGRQRPSEDRPELAVEHAASPRSRELDYLPQGTP